MAFAKKYSMGALAGITVLSMGAWWYQQSPLSEKKVTSAVDSPAARAVSVETGVVEVLSLQDDAVAVGTLKSRQSVMLRPEVAGRVAALGFGDGQTVRAGQVLVQLDDSLQRAEVKQSLAQVAIAKATFKRNQELVAQNFVAQRVLDENAASLEVAQAQLSLSCARLARMSVAAPFNGVVGWRSVNQGDYVRDGADLVNLEDLSSMMVDYRLPERLAAKIKLGQALTLQLDAFPGRQFTATIEALDPLLDANGRSVGVRAILPNTAGEPLSVASQASIPKTSGASKPISAASRLAAQLPTVREVLHQVGCSGSDLPANTVRGGVLSTAMAQQPPPRTNAYAPLRPGMFARVTTVFAKKDQALAIAEEAVVPQGGRQFVIRVVKASELPRQPVSAAASAAAAVATPDALVSLRQEVKLGLRRQGKVEVVEGLEAGQVIVLAGHQRLQRDGTPVKVVDMGRSPATAAKAASSSVSTTSAAAPSRLHAKDAP